MDTALRPMTISQLLDRTFQLYRAHFVLFAGIAAPTAAIGLIARYALAAVLGSNPDARSMASVLVTIAIGIMVQAVAAGATIYAVAAVHLGKSTSIAEAYRKLRQQLGNILKTIMLVNFRALWLFGVAAVLFVIAAQGGLFAVLGIFSFLTGVVGVVVCLIAYCVYALAVPACAVERLTPKQALQRSRFLTDNASKSVVLIYFLTWMVADLLLGILNSPVSMPGKFGLHPLVSGAYAGLWSNAAQCLADVLAGPIGTIAFAVLYFDQRVRKEALDLQLMMESMQQANSLPGPSVAIG